MHMHWFQNVDENEQPIYTSKNERWRVHSGPKGFELAIRPDFKAVVGIFRTPEVAMQVSAEIETWENE